jgi:hypothetical protein
MCKIYPCTSAPLHGKLQLWQTLRTRIEVLQDENSSKVLGRRKSSFTQLLGQASGLQDIFRRCS